MEDKQLNNLFDYTKFHIGLYTTLVSGLFAIIAYAASDPVLKVSLPLWRIRIVAVLILLAGAAAGAIASNIPEHSTFESFRTNKLKLFVWEIAHYDLLVHIEHAAFWLAIVLAAHTFLSWNI